VNDFFLIGAIGAVGAVAIYRLLPPLRRRLVCFLVRLFARIGLIKTPYGDYDAAMGNRGGDE